MEFGVVQRRRGSSREYQEFANIVIERFVEYGPVAIRRPQLAAASLRSSPNSWTLRNLFLDLLLLQISVSRKGNAIPSVSSL